MRILIIGLLIALPSFAATPPDLSGSFSNCVNTGTNPSMSVSKNRYVISQNQKGSYRLQTYQAGQLGGDATIIADTVWRNLESGWAHERTFLRAYIASDTSISMSVRVVDLDIKDPTKSVNMLSEGTMTKVGKQLLIFQTSFLYRKAFDDKIACEISN